MATSTENILRRVKESGFVRYLNGKWLDKLDNEITMASGSEPPTTITQVNNRAWDFGFKSSLTPEAPGDGFFRLSDNILSEVGLMWISDVDANGVSVVSRRGLINLGDSLYVVSKTNPNTVLSIWRVTGEVVLKSLYAEIPVSFVSGTILPAAVEPCEILHIPGGSSTALTEGNILTAMPSAVRFSFGGVGGAIDGFFTAAGEFVSFINPKYTFASLPTITAANDGSVVNIDPASFGGGSSRVSRDIRAVANFAENVWDPVGGRQLLYSAYGSAATPLSSMPGIVGHAPTQFDLGVSGNFSIPANFLNIFRGLHVVAKVGKTGTSAGTTAIATRFGKNNTPSDQLISSVTLTNTSLQQCNPDGVARVTSASSFMADSLGKNGQATNSIGDRSTSFDRTLVNYVSVTADASNDTDTHALYSLEIWWVK